MTVSPAGLQQALAQLNTMAAQASAKPAPISATQPADRETFGSALHHAIDQLDGMKKHAGATAHAFEQGKPGVSLANVMIDQQKAGLATNFDMRVRDEVVKAYRNIMNMQVERWRARNHCEPSHQRFGRLRL